MNASLLDKIRKLRALSQSSNLHEAAAAAAKVNQLIQEHRLSEAELEDPEVHEKATTDVEPLTAWGGRRPTWKRGLIVFLRKNNGCAGYNEWRMVNGKKCQVSVIVGRPSDVQTVRYIYAYLVNEITRLAVLEGKGKGKQWFTAFYMGALVGVIEAMKKADDAVRATATSTALVSSISATKTPIKRSRSRLGMKK
jgi:hypothetical protein